MPVAKRIKLFDVAQGHSGQHIDTRTKGNFESSMLGRVKLAVGQKLRTITHSKNLRPRSGNRNDNGRKTNSDIPAA